DTSGRPGRGGPPHHVIAQQFAGRDMGDVEVHGSSFPAPRRRCPSAPTATCWPAAPHSVIRGQRPPRRPTRQQQLTRQPEPAHYGRPRDAWLRRPSDLCPVRSCWRLLRVTAGGGHCCTSVRQGVRQWLPCRFGGTCN